MLTGLIEKGKSKCELYFPLGKTRDSLDKSYFYVQSAKMRDKFTFDSKNTQPEMETHAFEEVNEVTFGKYCIRFVKRESLDECHIRHLEVTKIKATEAPRIVYHYWFSNWPDHHMASPQQVLKIALDVLNVMETHKTNDNTSDISRAELSGNSTKFDLRNGRDSTNFSLLKSKLSQERRGSSECIKLPVIVHCSAGIGRTGCFLAILNGIQQLKANSKVDILAILCSLRLNRGGMIQTAEQYELVHRVLNLYTQTIE